MWDKLKLPVRRAGPTPENSGGDYSRGESLLGQGEGYERISLRFFVYFRVATGGDDHVLLAVLPHLLGHRHGVAAGGELGLPDFFSGLDIESADKRVPGPADENQAACGCYWAAKINRAWGNRLARSHFA